MLETPLLRVQRGEGPKVDKAILNVSIISGRIEEMGRKWKGKNVVYVSLSLYKQVRPKEVGNVHLLTRSK